MRKVEARPENAIDTILQVGQIVAGKYRVDHLAGKGGMAAVWAGTNQSTGKRVALKVILRSMATTNKAQHLFRREALAASRVNHPNVVTIFDVIDHEGVTCIVMELLDGEPLASYIDRKGCLSVSEATGLLLPAMRGVAAAHAQDVIHRDLKPQNIFVCIGPDGRVVTAKVLDFGISVMMERMIGSSARPVPGLSMGTPAYMSPEHLSGVARIDERVDVYGFGLLLYEALTGQMPFPGEPDSDLSRRVLTEPPPPVTKFRPDLPPGLVRVIDVAIAKDPNHRYSDLNLMITAIEEELLPATPLPQLITPITGVPAQAFRDALGGPSVVQAILRKEPSRRYLETKILFGFPREEHRVGAHSGQAGAASGARAKGGSFASPTSRETIFLPGRGDRAFLRIRLLSALPAGLYVALRAWVRFILGRRRELVGAGIAVVLALGVWMVVRWPGRPQAAGPASGTKVTHPAREAVRPSTRPSVVPSVTLAPATLEASPSAPGGPAACRPGEATSQGCAQPAPSPARGSRVVEQEPEKNSPHRRHGRSSAKAESPARVSRDRAASQPGKPRAGRLSEDDF